MDLLACGGVGHILLRRGTNVDLVDLSQELLGLRRVCGGGVVCHAVQPAVPEEPRCRGFKPTWSSQSQLQECYKLYHSAGTILPSTSHRVFLPFISVV